MKYAYLVRQLTSTKITFLPRVLGWPLMKTIDISFWTKSGISSGDGNPVGYELEALLVWQMSQPFMNSLILLGISRF